MSRNFKNIRRVVIKVGTNILSKGNRIDLEFIASICSQIRELQESGYQVILVSSGAIGMGAGELKITTRITDIPMRQACASIGQPLLMHAYREEMKKMNVIISQVLLTSEVLSNRNSFLNLRNAMEQLLELGVVPIVNENDCVSTNEIGNAFGDNDRLSAYIASKMNADLLILLTDIDALYDKNPHSHNDAEPLKTITKIEKNIEDGAGNSGSTFSTGGMKTKLAAAKIAGNAGTQVIIASGREKDILKRIISGEEVGTHFVAGKKISSRKRWIQNSSVSGKIIVDKGALEALKKKKSLLPGGIVEIQGVFDEGDVVSVNDCYKIVTSFTSGELKLIMGKHSREIREIFGTNRRDVVAPPEDIVAYQV